LFNFIIEINMHQPVARIHLVAIQDKDVITFRITHFAGSEKSIVGPFTPERHYVGVIVHAVNGAEITPTTSEMGFYVDRFMGVLEVREGKVVPVQDGLNSQNLWSAVLDSGPIRSGDQTSHLSRYTHFLKHETLQDTGIPAPPVRNAPDTSAQLDHLIA